MINNELEDLNSIMYQCDQSVTLSEKSVQLTAGLDIDYGAELQSSFNFHNMDELKAINKEEKRKTIDYSLLLENGEWGSYIHSIDELANDLGDTDLYQMALTKLITKNAPLKEIKKLINKVDQLPNNTIFILVRHDNVRLIEQLLPYGLNMDTKNERGQSVLEFALTLPASKNTIDFLNNI